MLRGSDLQKIFFILFFTLTIFSTSQAQAENHDNYLIEITTGSVQGEHEKSNDYGIEFETFLSGFHHHLAVGLVAEVETPDDDNILYVGPLVSLYYEHFKVFVSGGWQSHFDHQLMAKLRLGLGYEYELGHHFYLIPSVAQDWVEQESFMATNIGLARTF
ncbi:MAG: hypothetical protein AAF203_09565 [Pseudomonadota bacterium]